MLEDQDINRIGQLINASEKRIVEKVIKEVVDSVSILTDNLEKSFTDKIGTLADKVSINRMMDHGLEYDQLLDKKIDTATGFLAIKSVLSATEMSQLQGMKIPKSRPILPL